MVSNLVHKKIVEFATPTYLSVDEFLDLLKTSSRTHKMSIRWRTKGSADGSGKPPHTTQHLLWWDSSLLGTTERGIKMRETKKDQQQLNLPTTGREWRTLSYEEIDMVSFKGKLYKIK